jgi:hypothetical protein
MRESVPFQLPFEAETRHAAGSTRARLRLSVSTILQTVDGSREFAGFAT